MWLQPAHSNFTLPSCLQGSKTLQAIGACVGHYDATTVRALQRFKPDENAAVQSGELLDIEVETMKRKQLALGTCLIVAGLLLAGHANPVIAAKKLTELGIFPYLQTRSLVRIHTPLANSVAESLRTLVTIATAPDFVTFRNRALANEYDILIVPPNMTQKLIRKARYKPLAVSANRIRGVFIAKKNGVVSALAELRQRTVAVPSRIAAVTLLGKAVLREAHFDDDAVDLQQAGSHMNALALLDVGDVDVALIAEGIFGGLPRERRSTYRTVGVTESVPGIFILASERTKPDEITALKKLLTTYDETVDGVRYFATNAFKRFIPISKDVLNSISVFDSIHKGN